MPEKNEQIWRRRGSYHYVEIKVGKVWVQADNERFNTVPEAQVHAKRNYVNDKSILGVRVLELESAHTLTNVWEVSRGPELKKSEPIRPAKGKGVCPRCKLKVPLATDGENKWTACPKCSVTLPVAVGG